MKRRTGVVAAATSLTLAAGLVTVVMPAAANGTLFVPAGTLTLSTSAREVSFDPVGETELTSTQSLGTPGAGCIVPPSGDLLTFSGKAGNLDKDPGFKGSWIGVNEEYPVLCNLVDSVAGTGGGPEVLELKLGAELRNFADRPLVAKTASVTLAMGVRTVYTLTGRTTVEATAFAGTKQVGTAVTLSNNAAGCPSTSGTVICTLDIAPGGNFDTLKLKGVRGAFGLQGSSFNLVSEVDQAVDCKETTPPSATDVSSTVNTTVAYLGNVASTCTPFSFVLTSGDNQIEFLKPLDTNQDAQFVFDVVWTQPGTTPDFDVPKTYINFDLVGSTNNEMGFCPASLYDTNGKLVGTKVPAVLDSLPDWEARAGVAGAEGTQFACIGDSRTTKFTKDSSGDVTTLEVTDRIFLVGDARIFR